MKQNKKLHLAAVLCGEAAIFCLMEGTETKLRIYCPRIDYIHKTDLLSFLRRYENTPLFVMLDNADQTYKLHSMPGVGAMSISKLVAKRLERDFAAEDLKGAFNYGREKKGRKDWQFLFVNAPVPAETKAWLDFISRLSQPFLGIFLLPLEAQHLTALLAKKMAKRVKEKKKITRKDKAKTEAAVAAGAHEVRRWIFLSLTQKTGGVRQIVLEDGKVYFTRYVRYQINSGPEALAGVIEQEMSNTIDYLRRLSFSDKDETQAYVVTSAEIKNVLADSDFGGVKTKVYTPYEFSVEAGLAGSCRLDDKYADILTAAAFVKAKPALRLFTPELLKNYRMYKMATAAHMASLGMVPVFFICAGWGGWSIYDNKHMAVDLENKKLVITRNLKETEDVMRAHQKAGDVEKMTSAATVYSQLKEESAAISPAPAIIKAISGKQDATKFKLLKWTRAEPKEDEKENSKKKEPDETLQLGLDFYNTDTRPDGLFSNFDSFSYKMNKVFEGYDVQYSKLPEQLTFNSTATMAPMTITIRLKGEKVNKK